MIFLPFTIYQNIVEEDKDELEKKLLKDVIHQGLEGGGRIAKAKRQHLEFVMSMVRSEGYFRNVLLVHTNLMVARP